MPFPAPIHPGGAPVHAQVATGPAVTETNRRFKHDLSEHFLYQTVSEELKQHILAAVSTRYLCIFEDANYRDSDVSIIATLTHLKRLSTLPSSPRRLNVIVIASLLVEGRVGLLDIWRL